MFLIQYFCKKFQCFVEKEYYVFKTGEYLKRYFLLLVSHIPMYHQKSILVYKNLNLKQKTNANSKINVQIAVDTCCYHICLSVSFVLSTFNLFLRVLFLK